MQMKGSSAPPTAPANDGDRDDDEDENEKEGLEGTTEPHATDNKKSPATSRPHTAETTVADNNKVLTEEEGGGERGENEQHIHMIDNSEGSSSPPPSTSTIVQPSLIPGELSYALSFGKSFLSKLFTYCWTVLHTEDETLLQYANERLREREGKEGDREGERGEEKGDNNFLEEQQELKEALIRELGESIEYPLLPDVRVAKFLCTWLEQPKKAMREKEFAFTIQEWKDLLTLFALILKSDFDRLQDLR